MSDVNTGPDGTETHANNATGGDTAGKPDDAPGAQPDGNTGDSPDTFPRDYVEGLRKESAGYRDRAKTAEDNAEALSKRLHMELVKATGRLENAADLPYDAAHLDDLDGLGAALDALLTDRPYLAKRVVTGDAGQGPRGTADTGVSILGLLKAAG